MKLNKEQRYKERNIAAGLCATGCGRKLATATLCRPCADKMHEYYEKHKAERHPPKPYPKRRRKIKATKKDFALL